MKEYSDAVPDNCDMYSEGYLSDIASHYYFGYIRKMSEPEAVFIELENGGYALFDEYGEMQSAAETIHDLLAFIDKVEWRASFLH